MEEFLPSRVANRIAETQGDNRQGALNARSSRDDGRGRGRPSSDSEGRRQSWDGRAQRGQGGGRDSPQQWASDGRGSPRNQDSERPSHNRLDEATLSNDPARAARAQIANETLGILFEEKYTTPNGKAWDIRQAKIDLAKGTKFYSANDSSLSAWRPNGNVPFEPTAEVEFVEQSTIAAARSYAIQPQCVGRVGVLNFASATKRGGGFKNGAQAQEESLARASTLYCSLTNPDANKFYDTHIKSDHKGFYSHSMIYSRNVTLFRDEQDRLVDPSAVNMVTSAAVNAGSVRRKAGKKKPEDVESEICVEMLERMGRILKCFEDNGDKFLVLGSFGTGVFQNDVGMVAAIWARLLGHGGRFSQSFDRVEFAILGRPTYDQFKNAYNNELSEQVIRSMRAERARP
ncbi:hypothetical protein FRC00_007823 [Tulasnella sp. 408]|nr:hypothetical protein FRC00_007823 [Tulasnella sp. 408]